MAGSGKILGLACLIAAAVAVPAAAQVKVYTWTDARGRLHLTDEPPPAGARLQEVVESEAARPAEEVRADELRRRRLEKRREAERREAAEELERRAREAEAAAQEAIRRAEAQEQRALEIRERFGNTPSRREQFKYRIRAEEENAAAARLEAQRALERARNAAEEARRAAGQAAPPGAP
ncbi:MAG: DUF4124 domain-containing protein [Desulfobacterales bacterium]